MTKLRADLRTLIATHCNTIRRNVGEIRDHLDCLDDDGADLQRLEKAEACAHMLKGSSGSIGFHDFSAAAGALDDLLKRLTAAKAAPSADERTCLSALIDILEEAAAHDKAGAVEPLLGGFFRFWRGRPAGCWLQRAWFRVRTRGIEFIHYGTGELLWI